MQRQPAGHCTTERKTKKNWPTLLKNQKPERNGLPVYEPDYNGIPIHKPECNGIPLYNPGCYGKVFSM